MENVNLYYKDISLTEIKHKIVEIEELNLREIPFEELTSHLNLLMKGYSLFSSFIEPETLYRARINDSIDNFTNISQLRNPPKELVNIYGRLNQKNESIYYCSGSFETCSLELRPQVGDIVTIYRSKQHIKTKIHIFELGLRETIWKERGAIHDNKALQNYLGDKENIEKNKIIHNFLTEKFTQIIEKGEEYKYKITAAISYIFLQNKEIDGLFYPSITRQFKDINLGLKPEIYDKYYKPLDCFKLLIVGINETNNHQIKLLEVSKEIDFNGDIKWTKP